MFKKQSNAGGLFQSQCATSAKHLDWNCCPNSTQLQRLSKVKSNALLQYVDKTIAHNYHKKPPKFCLDCTNKLAELHPDLSIDIVTNDHTYCEEPAHKKAHLDYINNKSTQTDEVHILSNDLNISILQQSVLVTLANKIGKHLQKDLKNDVAELTTNKDIHKLFNLNLFEYLSQRNQTLVSFLLGIQGLDETYLHKHNAENKEANREDNKVMYKLCKSVESVLNLTSLRTIFPVHLRESVLIHTVGGSALSLQILASTSPYAAYKTVKAWMDKLGTSVELKLTGDLIAVFDNNQTMQRRWKVQLNNKVYCNVVTVVAFFQINAGGTIEFQSELRPGVWLLRGLTEAVKKVKFIDQLDYVNDKHTSRMYEHLDHVISSVLQDQTIVNENDAIIMKDSIDLYIEEKKQEHLFKKCFQCGKDTIPVAKINCPCCNVNLKASKLKHISNTKDTYAEKTQRAKNVPAREFKIHIDDSNGLCRVTYEALNQSTTSKVPTNKCSVVEPVFVNPCSYEAVTKVLLHIGKKSNIAKYNNGTGCRLFVPVYCDGSPYNLCFRVTTCTYRCIICSALECGLPSMHSHITSIHSLEPEEDITTMYALEFDWVLLQPGFGHIEMNMLKSLVEVCWDIFWKDLAYAMNFRSDKALQCCKKVSDHHKGWTLLRIAHDALSHELVVHFVRDELRKPNPSLTAVAFHRFLQHDVQDPTFLLIADCVLEFMQALFVFREGTREKQPDLMQAGIAKFAKLWSGRLHPLYRELEMSWNVSLARMPDELKSFIESTWSINTTGIPGTAEGPDFKLENVNKTLQALATRLPMWKRLASVLLPA